MKIIFVTGGVLSGIGKGIAAASIGALIAGSGKKVFCQKFDGYLNVDPGTMNPTQHGEVFVTADGAETDLDIGHYERFLDTDMNKYSSFTTGRLYEEIILKERRGDFLGGTVQIVPHLTDLVKEKIRVGFESSGADVSIVEIGGTVGDMENEYLLETARQLRHELGETNVRFVHVALLPYLMASKELKSKPIQHSVRTLMSYGINPDFLIVRADTDIPEDMMSKIASASGIPRSATISAPTLDSIYRVPLAFNEEHFGEKILLKLDLEAPKPDMKNWIELMNNIDNSLDVIRIGMVGKYVNLEDAYYSLNEGLKCAGFHLRHRIKIRFIEAEEVELRGASLLEGLDGICIPGGFGTRGTEGMIQAAEYARINKIPFLGICLGSQIMAIEFARNVLGIADASSEEFTPKGKNNIIHIMEDQKKLDSKGGNMRLGNYTCVIRKGSLAEKVYDSLSIVERHRHRFEFNPKYREQMEKSGFIVSATSPDGTLAEVVELKDHPYMIATQAHPELISRPHCPHPLFVGFVRAMI
ncbi:CTP synthase [Candidatus Gracilibacteria bacterium]|nr:CTP synthase [Candidatus Gracilibacteria bacterium]